MKKLFFLLLLLLPLALLTGCETPKTRILSQQTDIYGSPALQNIERSIIIAASKEGWAVEREPGVVHAAYRFSSRPQKIFDEDLRVPAAGRENYPKTVMDLIFADKNNGSTDFIRTTERVVYITISYNNNNYRIEYEDSINMGFDSESDSISNEYAEILKRLDRSIQAELAAAY